MEELLVSREPTIRQSGRRNLPRRCHGIEIIILDAQRQKVSRSNVPKETIAKGFVYHYRRRIFFRDKGIS